MSRKPKGSRNRRKQRERLANLHRRIGNVRRDFVHRHSSRLAKSHGHLVLETLCTMGSACSLVGDALPLSERTFRCSRCSHEADRDTNAATCLAQYPRISWPAVAAKQAETPNACGEGSAGAQVLLVRETTLIEAGRASAQRPRRAVLAATVNTL